MKTETNSTLLQAAVLAFDEFNRAHAALKSLQVDGSLKWTVASAYERGEWIGRRSIAVAVIRAITGFDMVSDAGRADAILALAALGVTKAQAALDAEYEQGVLVMANANRRMVAGRVQLLAELAARPGRPAPDAHTYRWATWRSVQDMCCNHPGYRYDDPRKWLLLKLVAFAGQQMAHHNGVYWDRGRKGV